MFGEERRIERTTKMRGITSGERRRIRSNITGTCVNRTNSSVRREIPRNFVLRDAKFSCWS